MRGIRRLAVLFESSFLRSATLRSSLLGWIFISWVVAGVSAFAQQTTTQSNVISASELAKENLDRVSASEAQITAVLNANPGLFVELKRWMAKDAADRGQILKDSDLRDSAVLSRLASDAGFRAAATRLLQGYGYLLPKANPDSEVGREQAALEQERIRELVATEQTQARQGQQNELAKCDTSSNRFDLTARPSRTTRRRQFRQTALIPQNCPRTEILINCSAVRRRCRSAAMARS
jgi:hypothetical protein